MKAVTVLVVLALRLGAGAASADDPTAGAAAGDSYRAQVAADGVQYVEIVGGSYFFSPARAIVKVNAPVVFDVRLEKGIAPHNLVIQAPEAGIVVDEELGRDVKRIRFTPTAVGSYPFAHPQRTRPVRRSIGCRRTARQRAEARARRGDRIAGEHDVGGAGGGIPRGDRRARGHGRRRASLRVVAGCANAVSGAGDQP